MTTSHLQCACGAVELRVTGEPEVQPVLAHVSPEQIGVGALLLPKGLCEPAFHIHCREAVAQIRDDLPHYATLPPVFGGSDDGMRGELCLIVDPALQGFHAPRPLSSVSNG